MKLLKGVLTLAIVFAFAATFADADGKKKEGKIRVKNKSDFGIAVIVDPSKKEYDNKQDFLADGGKILNPGQYAEFKVKDGDHVLAAVAVQYYYSEPTVENVKIHKNQTRCYCVFDDNGDPCEECVGGKFDLRIEEEDCNGNHQGPR